MNVNVTTVNLLILLPTNKLLWWFIDVGNYAKNNKLYHPTLSNSINACMSVSMPVIM